MEHELRQFTAPPPAYTSCGQPVPPRANPLFGPGSRSALRAAGRLVKRATKPAGKQPASEDDADELGAGPALVKELQTIRPYSRKKGCGWTKDEDKLLTDAVAIYGDVTGQWSRIAEMIPGRSSKVCRKRWFFCLNPAVRKGPFTAQEDAQLIALYQVHGPAWALIALSIPGRTDDSCAKRYRECLDPSIIRGGWSTAEDQVLKEGVAKYGSQWSQICLMKGLEGRKGLHCRNRWRTLSKDIQGRGAKRKMPTEAESADPAQPTSFKKPSPPLHSRQLSHSESTASPVPDQPVFSPASCQRLTDLLVHQTSSTLSESPAAAPCSAPDDAAIQSLLSTLAKEWASSTGSVDPLTSTPAPPTAVDESIKQTRSLEAFCNAISKATIATTGVGMAEAQVQSQAHSRFIPDALWDAISKSLARPIGLQDVAPEPVSARSSYLPNLLARTELSATLPYLDFGTLPNFANGPSPPSSLSPTPSPPASISPQSQYLDDAFLSRILSDNYHSAPSPVSGIKSIMTASDPSWPSSVPAVQTQMKFDWMTDSQTGINSLWDAWMTGISQPPPPVAATQHAPTTPGLGSAVPAGHTPSFSFSPWLTTTPLPATDESYDAK